MSKLKNTPLQKLIFLSTLCMICWVGCGIRKDTQDIAHNTKSIENINQKIDRIVESLQALEDVAISLNNIASHLHSIEQSLEPIENIAHLQELQNIANTLKNIQCEIDGLPLKEWIEKMIHFLETPLFTGSFDTVTNEAAIGTGTHQGEGEEVEVEVEVEVTAEADAVTAEADADDSTESSLAPHTEKIYSDMECVEVTRGQ